MQEGQNIAKINNNNDLKIPGMVKCNMHEIYALIQ